MQMWADEDPEVISQYKSSSNREKYQYKKVVPLLGGGGGRCPYAPSQQLAAFERRHGAISRAPTSRPETHVVKMITVGDVVGGVRGRVA